MSWSPEFLQAVGFGWPVATCSDHRVERGALGASLAGDAWTCVRCHDWPLPSCPADRRFGRLWDDVSLHGPIPGRSHAG